MEVILETPRFRLTAESKEAKQNIETQMAGICSKSKEIKEKKYVCGACAAFPCFRNPYSEDRAGLCYQVERECRQECDHFLQHEGSGKSPQFQITGTCKKDNQKVLYDNKCRFSDKN